MATAMIFPHPPHPCFMSNWTTEFYLVAIVYQSTYVRYSVYEDNLPRHQVEAEVSRALDPRMTHGTAVKTQSMGPGGT